jgi:hypothetical protein
MSVASRSGRSPRHDGCRKYPSRVNARYSISPTNSGATHCTRPRLGGRPGQPRARTNWPANGDSTRCRGRSRASSWRRANSVKPRTHIPRIRQVAALVVAGDPGQHELYTRPGGQVG